MIALKHTLDGSRPKGFITAPSNNTQTNVLRGAQITKRPPSVDDRLVQKRRAPLPFASGADVRPHTHTHTHMHTLRGPYTRAKASTSAEKLAAKKRAPRAQQHHPRERYCGCAVLARSRAQPTPLLGVWEGKCVPFPSVWLRGRCKESSQAKPYHSLRPRDRPTRERDCEEAMEAELVQAADRTQPSTYLQMCAHPTNTQRTGGLGKGEVLLA